MRARLEWLALETIAYSACEARNRLHFDLAPGAEMAWRQQAWWLAPNPQRVWQT